MKAKPPPPWLGKALAIAEHEDRKARWPWWQRLAHRLLIARRCPCCQAKRAMDKDWKQHHHQRRWNA